MLIKVILVALAGLLVATVRELRAYIHANMVLIEILEAHKGMTEAQVEDATLEILADEDFAEAMHGWWRALL